MSPRVLVVDDDRGVVTGLERVLRSAGIGVISANGVDAAWELLATGEPDVVLADLAMPGADGISLCRRIRANGPTKRLPVLFLTGNADASAIEAAFEAGGDDYIVKPPRLRELLARVRAAAERYRLVRDLDDAEAVLLSLGRAVEAKDPTTADHCDRLSRMAVALGHRLALCEEDLEALRKGGALHDIGKIGIADGILLKAGPLTQAEREVMKGHSEIGAKLIAPLRSVARAIPIVRHHHERLDGSGYPDGLAGDRIPLLARVFQVCDVFDALTRPRPYREAVREDKALLMLAEEARRGWWEEEIVARFGEMIRSW